MINSFPKDIQDYMKQCILSIFWPKDEIINFFKSNSCTVRELPSKPQKERMSRREIVEYVFEKLLEHTDKGLGQFRAILQSLEQWSYFDEYWFEEKKQLNKNKAIENLSRLRVLASKRDEKIKEDRIRREKLNQLRQQKKVDIGKLKTKYIGLFTGKDEEGKVITNQQRGYMFENLIDELFSAYNIPVSSPFKIEGEQIDGSIKYEGEHYIMELKW